MKSITRGRLARLAASGGIVAVSVLAPSAAFGAYGPGDSNTGSSGGDAGVSAGGASAGGSESSGGTLPFTGGDVVGIALIGAGAVVGGTALARANRRRVVAEV